MALTIRTRRKIFYTLVILFVLVGGAVVSYAQGWRLDFTTWRFEKIGGIYVRSYPEDASIYLNGKPIQSQSGFLSPGTLISDLLPQTYSLSLKAAGYDDWQENAAVSPALVTQFKYAVLVPSEGTPTASSTLATTLEKLATLNPTSTAVDQFDQNQKVLAGRNKISIFNIDTATTTASTTIPGENLSVKWITSGLVGILQTNGELYIYNPNDAGNGGQSTASKLADDVKSFSASNDGSMVAALERNSLEIFPIDSGNGANEESYYRFNIPDIADAESVIWYKDNTHAFVVYPDHVAFLDLTDSNLINFAIVADGTRPEYDPNANTLYIIADTGKLMAYVFPN